MGCQTTQSANKDTKPADIEPIITEEKKPINPYAKKEIPEDLQIMTSKPIVCGRVDKVLGRVKKVYGEEPVLLGQGTMKKEETGKLVFPLITLTYNRATGTFSFFESSPMDSRIICMLSHGKGKVLSMPNNMTY